MSKLVQHTFENMTVTT